MSNQPGVDLLLTGPDTITAIINLANKTSHVVTDLVIGSPRPSADEAYNTDIEVTFPIAPSAGDPSPDPVTGEFHYSRLDLGRLFAHKHIRLRDTATPYDTVHDLLAPLLGEARVLLEVDDIVDSAIPAGAYPKAVVVKAEPLSLRFTGQFSIELLAPVVDDTSFLTVPAETENSQPAQAARNVANHLILTGQGTDLATAMMVATNGEIEVAAAARNTQLPMAIPSVSGVYHLDIGANGDWSIPVSFLLKDDRNGDKITDLYDCTVKVTAPGGGVLNFALTRQYGKLALIDSANNLTVDDPSLYNLEQSLYQTVQRVSFYKSKLGSLSLNAYGAPVGTYDIEVKAVRKAGGTPDVVVTFQADVTGVAAP